MQLSVRLKEKDYASEKGGLNKGTVSRLIKGSNQVSKKDEFWRKLAACLGRHKPKPNATLSAHSLHLEICVDDLPSAFQKSSSNNWGQLYCITFLDANYCSRDFFKKNKNLNIQQIPPSLQYLLSRRKRAIWALGFSHISLKE